MSHVKLQYCSDLHLEFTLNTKLIKKHPLKVIGDVLLLAGDIIPFAQIDAASDFLSFVSDNFEHTYWVPGNHEYYHSDIAERSGHCLERIRTNVTLVNNAVIEYKGVALIFSTLWSRIDPTYEWQIERAMSDFHVIKYKGYRFSIPVFNQLHDESMAFLRKACCTSGSKEVVVTHHIPTFMHYPKQYLGDIINQAFATELSDFIEVCDIDAWIFGHHHHNMPEFMIGNTRMLTNQLGYVKYGENTGFDPARLLIIDTNL